MQPQHENKDAASPRKNVLNLSIKNFMSVKDAKLELGKITQIVGGNSQGKTTLIKAIQTAIKGSSDTSLITNGEDRMEIILELPDETHIRRTMTSKGGKNVTVDRGGFVMKAPQAYLEELFDYKAFNPLDIISSDNCKEAILKAIDIKITPELLAERLGITVDKLPPQIDYSRHGIEVMDVIYNYIYTRRAEANKDALNKKNKWTVNKDALTPIEEPTSSRAAIDAQAFELGKKKQSAEGQLAIAKTAHENNEKALKRVQTYETEISKINLEIANVESEYQEALKKLAHEKEVKLKGLETRLDSGKQYLTVAKEEVKEALPNLDAFKEEISGIEREILDLAVESEKLKTWEAAQNSVKMVSDLENEFKAAEQFAEGLTSQLEKFSTIKDELMASAEMPVEGMSFVDGQFYVDKNVINNLSASQKMKLSLGVARKHAKAIKIIFVDGIEILDAEQTKLFMEEIQKDDFHYVTTSCREPVEGVGTVVTMKNGAMQ